MVSMTVRDIPESTRYRLALRAAESGQSLQQYMLGKLIELAEQTTLEEALRRTRVRRERQGTVDLADDIVAIIRDARGEI